ncbi:hypothetical protein NDN01_25310 [Sphingomonas sp. QA11]|uniref:hypothetical protein n=1 Tax=Sphingomonas sp. QA11 TaxID=2950605 RepID=UPI00234A87C4|nr:hypothetical protein [Sphingomonas sp. QA11]WCM27261.1 hypothetical protein NDN01_25310 [Sphingomonas sp. QA11]
MIPVVIGFGAIAVIAGSATILLPLIKAAVTHSQKRRRSKNRRKRSHGPRQRIDLIATKEEIVKGTEPPPPADNGRRSGDSATRRPG